MHRNKDLYNYLISKVLTISEDWYNAIEENDPRSVYAATEPRIVNELKEQNKDYIMHVLNIFIKPASYIDHEFKQWSEDLADDNKHLETPLQSVVREYLNVQEIILKYIKEYYYDHQQTVTLDQVFSWFHIVSKAINISIVIYINAYHVKTAQKMQAQTELISELSSPIIVVQKQVAMLPLVGDIDTTRAKLILEKTPSQCVEKNITHLCIDLSGVAFIDTMVAHQIFNLVKALKLIGVDSTISGIRPEIAQTSIQLGLDFTSIRTTSSLEIALENLK